MSKAKSVASHHRTNVTALVALAALAVLVAVVIIQYSRDSISVDTTTNLNDFTILIDATITSSGDITTYHFTDTNILNIMPLSYKAMVLNETPVTNTEIVSVGEVSAELLTLRSAKDGATIKVVQIEHGDQLFDFRGSDEFLNTLSKYVQFN